MSSSTDLAPETVSIAPLKSHVIDVVRLVTLLRETIAKLRKSVSLKPRTMSVFRYHTVRGYIAPPASTQLEIPESSYLKCAITLGAMLAFALPVVAQEASSVIVVKQGWSRATPAGTRVAVGYLTLTNTGKMADRLLSVSSPMAARVEIHESSVIDGIARMRPVDAMTVTPGTTVALKPGGLHLMLMQPHGRFAPGDKVPVMLVFEKAGRIAVDLVVQAVGATSGPADEHEGHDQ